VSHIVRFGRLFAASASVMTLTALGGLGGAAAASAHPLTAHQAAAPALKAAALQASPVPVVPGTAPTPLDGQPAPPAPVAASDTDATGQQWCASDGHGACGTNPLSYGKATTMANAGDGRLYTLYAYGSGTCNDGRVSSNCPFTPGLGLNNTYLGDPIVFLDNTLNSICLGADDSADGITRNCPGGQTTYGDMEVQCANNCHVGIGGIVSGFIDVQVTNFADTPNTVFLEHSGGGGKAWNFNDTTSDGGEYNWNYCTSC
jgi:hypothetical protein